MPAKYDFEDHIEKYLSDALDGYSPRRRNEKVIRDAIGGFVRLDPHEIALIDSPIFQRLRNIFQTSLAVYTYPTANHSRFEHSLGCLTMADKIITTLNLKYKSFLSIQEQYVIRLAALLHDIGHGPFSHASEAYYEDYDEINAIKKSDPDMFNDASPHEIMGYFILKSKRFKKLWGEIVEECEPTLSGKEDLRKINIEHVPPLILGKPYNKEKKFIAQIINGPFDVDKIDYLQRDGYFSGIQTALDIDRLFLTIGVHKDEETEEEFLYTDIGGATVLEQMLFNKMILYSSMYHHHKVRSGVVELQYLFDVVKNSPTSTNIRGLKLEHAIDFLKLDDYDILNSIHKSREIMKIVERIKNREFLRRALVICPQSMKTKKPPFYSALQYDKRKRVDIQREICKSGIGIQDIYIDCPRPATFQKGTLESLVKISKNNFIKLDGLYPVSGWVKGYAEYRYRGYVFARTGLESRVSNMAYEILRSRGLELNKNAFLLAKQEPPSHVSN